MELASVRRLVPPALALALLAAAPAVAQPGGAVAGRVTDAATGRPVARVDVVLYDYVASVVEVARAVSDRHGRYRLDGVEPGRYHVVAATSAGYLGELSDGTRCLGRLVFSEVRGYRCGERLVPAPPIVFVAAGGSVEISFALDLGAVIAGRVSDATTGEALAGVEVHATDPPARRSGTAVTGADGRYRIDALPLGRYWVNTATLGPLADEVYDGVHCDGRGRLPGGCEPRGGTRVPVGLRQRADGIDFALEPLAAIAGRVTAAGGGEPLAGVAILARRDDGAEAGAVSGADGGYLVGGLLPGDYRVYASEDGERVDELWDGVHCPGFDCDPGDATLVAAAVDQVTEGVDFALETGAALSGTVTAQETGVPLPGVGLRLLRTGGGTLFSTTTDDLGRYRFAGLAAGGYHVHTLDAESVGLTDEAFGGVACGLALSDCRGLGAEISLALGEETGGVDFTLEPPGAIEGRVVYTTGGTVPLVTVAVIDPRGGTRVVFTDDFGSWVSGPLPRGEYKIQTRGWNLPVGAAEFIDQLYEDLPCFLGRCDPADGTPVPVASGATTGGIEIRVRLGAAIEGRVSREDDGRPLQFTLVTAFDAEGRFAGRGQAGSDGRYRVVGLPDGAYWLATSERFGIAEVYDRIQCIPGDGLGCEPLEGTPVVAEAATAPPQIDFALALGFRPNTPCRQSPTRLCLAGGRFEVGIARDVPEFGDPGRPLPISDSAGAFTFFADDNVEAVVRVVDACAAFDRFWVFAASLSHLHSRVGVRDTVTGDAWFDFGLSVRPVLDTAAFAGCDAGPVPAPVAWGVSGRGLELGAVPAAAAMAAPEALTAFAGAVATSGAGGCVPDSTTLCLLGGRFAVSAEWTDGAGGSGDAGAASLGDRSGYLWFHRPGSPEVVVKILDACTLDPPAFRLFASGLTTSEVSLTVTDTAALAQRTYFNPLGQAFLPIRDSEAFGSCP
jgi:protocatechuate 3,4-dioxygenase beta subunit